MNERFKQLRDALGLTLEEMSSEIGLSNQAVSNWEHGRPIPESRIRTICRIYNVNPEWLRTGNGEMFVNAAKEVERLSDNELISELNNRGYVAYLNPMDGWQTVEFVGAGF